MKQRHQQIRRTVITAIDLTTLASDYTSPATTIVLTDASSFPSSGTFIVNDDNQTEVGTYTGKSGNTLTGVTGLIVNWVTGNEVYVENQYSQALDLRGFGKLTVFGTRSNNNGTTGGNSIFTFEPSSDGTTFVTPWRKLLKNQTGSPTRAASLTLTGASTDLFFTVVLNDGDAFPYGRFRVQQQDSGSSNVRVVMETL